MLRKWLQSFVIMSSVFLGPSGVYAVTCTCCNGTTLTYPGKALKDCYKYCNNHDGWCRK